MTEETNSRTGFYASFPRVYPSEQGRYVEYADYARLKAEVERLEAELSNITGWGRGLESDLSWARAELMQVKAEVERLKEDNRQLTKAFEIAEGIIKRMGKAAEDAAKEGKGQP
jgi:chromosome segregation ATPase